MQQWRQTLQITKDSLHKVIRCEHLVRRPKNDVIHIYLHQQQIVVHILREGRAVNESTVEPILQQVL